MGSRNSVGGSRNSVGGGGFVNPKTSGANAYKTNPYGTRQYSGYSSSSVGGVHSYGGKSYGYRTPGYGTSWGTNFAGGAGRYSKGYSGKALGLGVAAGFLGGAALSTMGTMAMYSVYHRYHMYNQMMYMNNPGMYGYNQGYYNNYYNTNTCRYGCPINTHCEWVSSCLGLGISRVFSSHHGRVSASVTRAPPGNKAAVWTAFRPGTSNPDEKTSTPSRCVVRARVVRKSVRPEYRGGNLLILLSLSC